MEDSILKDFILVLAGGIVGFITSFLVWWFTTRKIVPKIRFSDKISKMPDDNNPSGYTYKVRFKNIGTRDIIDISIYGLLRIKGLCKYDKELLQVIKLPIGVNNHILISPCEKKDNKGIRQCQIKIHDCDRFARPLYGDEINKLVAEGKLTLEKVLSLGTYSELKFVLIGTDRYSGARKYIESDKLYNIDDIVDGYHASGSLDIIKTDNK
jgi:hypothetical protein